MTIKSGDIQVGLSTTNTNNFVFDNQTSPGTLAIGRGILGASTTLQSIDSAGNFRRVIPGGTTLYPEFVCRAWAYFSYTATNVGGLIAEGNISLLTRNSVGNYTVTFETPMPDSNYSAVFGGTPQANLTNEYIVSLSEMPYQGIGYPTKTRTTTSLRFGIGNPSADVVAGSLAIFR